MGRRQDQATVFRALHVRGHPLVLFNIWDAGGARVVAEVGAKAIATGSWSVAAAHGYGDGEQLPLDLALANLERIAEAVDLPVTVDLEGGYGAAPATVAETARRAIEAGAVGFNIEDQIVGGQGLYGVEEQAKRLAAVRRAADATGVTAFLNARTDVFLKGDRSRHDEAQVDAALERARAYADAGADGLFAPGLQRAPLIERLCERSPLPVNIMAAPGSPPAARLAELGVARISHGAWPYRLTMEALTAAARAAHG